MNYSSALKYLFSFINFERLPFEYKRQFNLKRMVCLLDWFGHPEHSFSSVLIAGTKGKGSTANFLASILRTNNYQVGLYTSPHLFDPRERIRINGQPISKNELAKLIARIRPVIKRRKREVFSLGPITFFEIFTLAAILYFAYKKVKFGVFEVGMGGRLDATNVLKPLVSVITPISFDHEEHLGYSLSSIAKEKAAIIKPDSFVVSSEQKPEVLRVIKKQIQRQKAKGYFFGSTFKTAREKVSLNGGNFDFCLGAERWRNFKVSLLGRFQIRNAATALACASVLENQFGFELNEGSIKQGFLEAFWPGRFEVVKREARTFVLDGAHNDASMEQARLALNDLFPKSEVVTILGVSREKNLEHILTPLISRSSHIIVTKSNNPRAQEPKVILETLVKMGYKKPTFWASDLKEAIELAERIGPKNAVLFVIGSMFLVGEAREILRCQKFV